MAQYSRGDDGRPGRAGARHATSDQGGLRRRRPSYLVHGRLFCFHRGQRPDAIDPETGECMADVLMFRVADQDEKDLLLADDRGLFFTTPHFNGYPAVLMRIDRKSSCRERVEMWVVSG